MHPINISKEHIDHLFKPLFTFLWSSPDGRYINEIIEYIEKNCDLSEFELGHYSFAPYLRRYEIIIRVGIIPLVKTGWLAKTNSGRLYITNTGRDKAKQFKSADQFFKQAISYYDQWRDGQDVHTLLLSPVIYQDAQEKAYEQYKNYIRSLDTNDIKRVLTNLFSVLGYYIISDQSMQFKTGHVDFVASKNQMGIDAPKVFVQMNCTSTPTSAEEIYAFASFISEKNLGTCFSLSGFPADIHSKLLNKNLHHIGLIDLESLYTLWLNNIEKMSYESMQILPFKRVYFLCQNTAD